MKMRTMKDGTACLDRSENVKFMCCSVHLLIVFCMTVSPDYDVLYKCDSVNFDTLPLRACKCF